jgi:hypothetical protein
MIDAAAALAILTIAGLGLWFAAYAMRVTYTTLRARRRAQRRKGYVTR